MDSTRVPGVPLPAAAKREYRLATPKSLLKEEAARPIVDKLAWGSHGKITCYS